MAEGATVYAIYLRRGHDSNTPLIQWVVLTVPFTPLKGLKNYADVFSVKDVDVLLLNGPFDHAIETEEKDPLYKPLYNLSEGELKVLWDYLDNAVMKRWIWPSVSPMKAPIMFIPKKDRGLRLCVNYHGLNQITVKNRHPLPLIQKTLDRLSNVRVFTKLDLKDVYH